MVRTQGEMFDTTKIVNEQDNGAAKPTYTNGILGGLGITNLAQQGGIATNLAELKLRLSF